MTEPNTQLNAERLAEIYDQIHNELDWSVNDDAYLSRKDQFTVREMLSALNTIDYLKSEVQEARDKAIEECAHVLANPPWDCSEATQMASDYFYFEILKLKGTP